ncbi:MAG: LytTR family DNA-binding domain-containing protein [Pseudomonadota bacterium]
MANHAAQAQLRAGLAHCLDLTIVAECMCGFEAIDTIARMRPDVVFLDVALGGMSCFEVMELATPRPHFIFVSEPGDWMGHRFSANGLDYLSAPFSHEQLHEALAHVRGKLVRRRGLSSVLTLSAFRWPPLTRILVRDGEDLLALATETVDFIEAQGHVVQINANGKGYLKVQRLDDLQQQLDPRQFVRVHPAYLLNVGRFQEMIEVTLAAAVLVRDGSCVPLSRSGRALLEHALGTTPPALSRRRLMKQFGQRGAP